MNAGSATMEQEGIHNRVSGIDVDNLTEDQIKALHDRSSNKEVGDKCSCGNKFIRKVHAMLPSLEALGEGTKKMVRVEFPECLYSCCQSTPT